jgi:outer membrane protein assembly factor BamB
MFKGPSHTPAASETTLFVASRDHSLYAFSADGGVQLWQFRTDAPIEGIPTYHDGRVYCAVPRLGLTAFDAANGKPLWSLKDNTGHVVCVRNGRLVVWMPDADGKSGGQALLVDPASGDVIERAELEQVAMLRPDAFVDGNLYLVSPSGVVTKLQPIK